MPQYTMSAGIPHPGVFVNAQISSIPPSPLTKAPIHGILFMA